MNFNNLVNSIQETHSYLQEVAAKAVNTPMTIRNWLIGYYIVEFEQKGEDRARYGDNLINELVEKLKGSVNGVSATNFKLYRQFYNTYPEIIQTVSEYFKHLPIVQMSNESFQISQTPSDQLNSIGNTGICQTVSDKLVPAIYETINKFPDVSVVTKKYGLAPDKLLKLLSFSHIVELVKVDDELKRAFYEIECVKGVWSVRELKRQIESLYFERSGLSKDKKKLSAMVQQQAVQLQAKDIINTPFAIEFLGLNQRALVTETDLEQAIIDHLIGILLYTDKGNTMVKYATAGLDQNIFVQKYMVALPDKEELEAYLRREMQ